MPREWKCVAIEDGDYYILNGTKNWITRQIGWCGCSTPQEPVTVWSSGHYPPLLLNVAVPDSEQAKKPNECVPCIRNRKSWFLKIVETNANFCQKAMALFRQWKSWMAAESVLQHYPLALPKVHMVQQNTKEREQFANPYNFQAISKLADMATRIQAAELLTARQLN